METTYRIISSHDGDWFIASKLENGNVIELHDGHDREQCYKSILDDLGIDVQTKHVNMEDGSYTVTKEDFE